jgi:hypothetical protein
MARPKLHDEPTLGWDSSFAPLGNHPARELLTSGIVDPDQVFAELDNLELAAGDGHWRVEVFSVTDQEQHRWVQISVVGERDYMLTLRLPAGAGASSAIPALTGWLKEPSAISHIVDATDEEITH